MNYRLAAMITVALFSLAGCGDPSAPAANSTSTPPATSAANAAASKKPQNPDAVDTSAAEAQADAAATDSAVGEVDLAAGEAIYNRSCLSCHAAGIANAPKLGSAEDWGPRAAKGLEALVQSSLAGVPPAMPAKGLCFDCSAADMRNVVSYMLSKL